MNCVLIRAANRVSPFEQDTQECLGLGYVGAALRGAGHSVALIDGEIQHLSNQQIAARAAELRPGLIGVSLMCEDGLDSCALLVRELRRVCPCAHVCMGGNLPTFAPEWVLRMCPGLDSVIRFEGEIPAVELAGCLESGLEWRGIAGLCSLEGGRMRQNQAGSPVDNLDRLAFPIRDMLPAARDAGLVTPVSTSRGCYGKCAFCAVHQFNPQPGRPWRARTPGNVVDELSILHDSYGVREVNFVDDDFLGNAQAGRERALAIAGEIVRRRLKILFSIQARAEWIDRETLRALKTAGLKLVFFGIESVDPVSAGYFQKRQTRATIERALDMLRKSDIYTHIGFIMFNPWTKLEDVDAAVDFLHAIGHLNVHTATNFLQLSPGTPLLHDLLRSGVASREPGGGFSWEYADPRTGALKALFDRVVWPLFPQWYQALTGKWAALREESPADSTTRVLEAFDNAIYDVAKRAIDALKSLPGTDLFLLAEELRDQATRRLEAEMPSDRKTAAEVREEAHA